MSDHHALDAFRPFENLNKLLKKESVIPDKAPAPSSAGPEPAIPTPTSDEDLFQKAMVGVKRLTGPRRVEKVCVSIRPLLRTENQDQDACERLKALVKSGEGFQVSQTPEYIEGSARDAHPTVLSRLHRGAFSVQDYIDLHGLCLEEAKEQFQAFLKHAIARGQKAVLIVHGRGLSSPDEPVLKRHVVRWLNSGVWRKWIVAYASARMCDGGAGATYLLLRDYPRNKGSLKRHS
jgi:DNA-nicking Smr family endonuclease